MAREFHLSVVAPDRSVAEENVVSVIAPGQLGYFGVLAGHEAMVIALRPGLMEYTDPTNRHHYVALGGGFAEVSAGRVTILADSAARAEEIDIQREEAALEEARKAIRGGSSEMTTQEAMHAIEHSMARIRAYKTGK